MGTAELNGASLEIIAGYVFSVTEMSGECVLGDVRIPTLQGFFGINSIYGAFFSA